MLKVRVIPCLDVKDGRVVKGVRFVDLATATEAEAVDTAVVDALGLTSSLGADTDARRRVADYLGERHLLVVLDNC